MRATHIKELAKVRREARQALAAVKVPVPKTGDLRVWWLPQVPMEPFYFPIRSVEEAKAILTCLARYDLFQLAFKIKPDYSNAGGLEIWEDGNWSEWYDDEGRDMDEVLNQVETVSV